MALDAYKIVQTDIDAVAVHTTVTSDRLSGTVLQNKQVFDAYPDMIVTKFNALCDYVGSQTPSGDCGLEYTDTEITFITSALGCTYDDIKLT